MLEALGFADRWIWVVMFCVRTVSYNVLFGDDSIGPIFLERGLRQSNPLSPYLFILVAEGLSVLIQQREAAGLIHGVQIQSQVPSISHLFFVNDCYLLFRASVQESQTIKEIFHTYKVASGQEASF